MQKWPPHTATGRRWPREQVECVLQWSTWQFHPQTRPAVEDEQTFSSQLRHTCTAHVYKGQNVSLLSAFPLTCIHTHSSPPTPHGSLLSTDTFVKGYTLNLNICTHRVNCSLPPLKKQHSLLHTHTQMHTHTRTQTHTHTYTYMHMHTHKHK